MKSPGETSAGKTKVIYMFLMFHTFKDVRSVLCAVCVGGDYHIIAVFTKCKVGKR